MAETTSYSFDFSWIAILAVLLLGAFAILAARRRGGELVAVAFPMLMLVLAGGLLLLLTRAAQVAVTPRSTAVITSARPIPESPGFPNSRSVYYPLQPAPPPPAVLRPRSIPLTLASSNTVSGQLDLALPEREPSYRVKRAAKAPVIDGKLDEWQDVEPIVLDRSDQVRGDEAWLGPGDLSGKLRMLWDEKQLYFALEVQDDDVSSAGVSYWDKDCCQFVFDTLLDGPQGNFDAEDLSYFVSRDAHGPVLGHYRVRGVDRETLGLMSDATVRFSKTQSGYVYEWSLSWKRLAPVSPWILGRTGFSFSINDNDGGKFKRAISWTAGGIYGLNAAALGEIVFDGAVGTQDAVLELPPCDRNHGPEWVRKILAPVLQANSAHFHYPNHSDPSAAGMIIHCQRDHHLRGAVRVFQSTAEGPHTLVARGSAGEGQDRLELKAGQTAVLMWDLAKLPPGNYEVQYENSLLPSVSPLMPVQIGPLEYLAALPQNFIGVHEGGAATARSIVQSTTVSSGQPKIMLLMVVVVVGMFLFLMHRGVREGIRAALPLLGICLVASVLLVYYLRGGSSNRNVAATVATPYPPAAYSIPVNAGDNLEPAGPNWAGADPEKIGADFTVPVRSGLQPTRDEAEAALDKNLKRTADRYINQYLGPGAAAKVAVDAAFLRSHALTDQGSGMIGNRHEETAQLRFEKRLWDILKQRLRFREQQLATDEKTANETPAGQPRDNAPPAVSKRPDWVDAQPRLVDADYRVSVSSGPYSTMEECEGALNVAIRTAGYRYIDSYLGPGAARKIALDPDFFKRNVIERYPETVHASVGPMHQLHVLLSLNADTRAVFEERLHNALVDERLWRVGAGVAGLLAVVATGFAYLKIDLLTGQHYRRRLQAAAALVILIVAAVVLTAI